MRCTEGGRRGGKGAGNHVGGSAFPAVGPDRFHQKILNLIFRTTHPRTCAFTFAPNRTPPPSSSRLPVPSPSSSPPTLAGDVAARQRWVWEQREGGRVLAPHASPHRICRHSAASWENGLTGAGVGNPSPRPRTKAPCSLYWGEGAFCIFGKFLAVAWEKRFPMGGRNKICSIFYRTKCYRLGKRAE